ncbi:MAG: DOMON-like domain-containing protein [Burkholderiaceae bacterium]
MEPLGLVSHPQHPPAAIRGVQAHLLGIDAGRLRLRWRVDGAHALVLPPAAGTARADGLWQTTCFEVFLRRDGRPDDAGAYVEWNLSPSGRWNAYDFVAYREGMAPRPLPRAPETSMRSDGDDPDRALIFDAALPLAGAPPLPCRLGISAVIEEHGGIKSYWALAHPAAGGPDFHAAACWSARLEPSAATP